MNLTIIDILIVIVIAAVIFYALKLIDIGLNKNIYKEKTSYIVYYMYKVSKNEYGSESIIVNDVFKYPEFAYLIAEGKSKKYIQKVMLEGVTEVLRINANKWQNEEIVKQIEDKTKRRRVIITGVREIGGRYNGLY